jgi:hypothetical protein
MAGRDVGVGMQMKQRPKDETLNRCFIAAKEGACPPARTLTIASDLPSKNTYRSGFAGG